VPWFVVVVHPWEALPAPHREEGHRLAEDHPVEDHLVVEVLPASLL